MRILTPTVLLVIALLLGAAELHAQRLLRIEEPIYTFGESLAAVGDLNGDGHDDILVGAPRGPVQGENPGLIRIYSGADGSLLLERTGDQDDERFGQSLCGTGDLDGDGVPDFVVGSPRFSSQLVGVGRVKAYSGADGSLLYECTGDLPYDAFGTAVCSVGDANRDGHADFAASAPSTSGVHANRGYVRVFSGKDGSVLATLPGEDPGDGFGSVLARAGDVNADGRDDLLVGTIGFRVPGVWVLSGRDGSRLLTLEPPADGPWYLFGASADGAGDTNGDGFDDLVVGAPGTAPGQADYVGAIMLFSGADGSLLGTRLGDWAKHRLGTSVAGAGDVNDDGFDDVIAGAPQDNFPGERSVANGRYGSARVYSGLDGAILYTMHGEVRGQWLGYHVAAAGDVNGDGIADFMAGTHRQVVLVFAGRRQPQLSNPQPGNTGVPNTLTVTGATPNGRVHFLAGARRGRFESYLLGRSMEPCRFDWGTISISRARRISRRFADAAGTATLTRTVPLDLSGHTILLQAMDFESCSVSELLTYAFP